MTASTTKLRVRRFSPFETQVETRRVSQMVAVKDDEPMPSPAMVEHRIVVVCVRDGAQYQTGRKEPVLLLDGPRSYLTRSDLHEILVLMDAMEDVR